MSNSKSKLRIGSSILILFVLTMSLSFSATPLVIAKATPENVALTQSREKMTSHESFDTPIVRNFDAPEPVSDFSYDYDYLRNTDSKEWVKEEPDIAPFQIDPPVVDWAIPHPTIVIDSNDDFETQGWPGEGTPSVPYLIDDLIITATAEVPGISISGTDVFFVISDCVINGSYQPSTGIALDSVANALILNTTCYEGGIGILLNQTDEISVIENQCYSMTRAGIYLDMSDSNFIWDNFVTDCWDGIFLERSDDNDLQRNFCAGNNVGIALYWTSNTNSVFNNTLISNTGGGIVLNLECTLNTIILNYLAGNGYGLLIDGSHENTIFRNRCEANLVEIQLVETELNIIDNNTLVDTSGSSGLVLFGTNNTLIVNNLFYRIMYPIWFLGDCSDIDLIDNNCTLYIEGLTIEGGSDILVQDCYFDSDGYTYSIHAMGTTNLEIIDSEFYVAEVQILLEDCDHVDVIGNNLDTYLGGIINDGSNSTTIKDNLCQHGEQGIYSVFAYNCMIDNNTVLFHSSPGSIFIGDCPGIIVANNNCTASIEAIDVYASQGAWLRDNWCYLYDKGIYVETSNYTTITRNCMQNGTTTGIHVVGSYFVDVLDNDVINSPTGIHLMDCVSSLVSRNNCTENYIPSIQVESSRHCNVTYNVITDTIDGIVLGLTNHSIVAYNHITLGQGYGIGVWDSNHNLITRNHIANISGWEGWPLPTRGSFNNFTYNLCENSIDGIFVDDGAYSLFTHNIVRGNNESIVLMGGANFTVSWNVFEDNLNNGVDHSANSTIDYNYWSDYVGVDANGDGIGDTPHPVMGAANNNDTHPLVYHPTLPVWASEPIDQTAELGHAFQYTLSVITSTELAPIVDWWISDSTNFVVNDGTVENAVFLELDEYPLELRAINLYGFALSAIFTVTVSDTVAPTIVGPDDFDYVVGQVGRTITWIPEDYDPASYSVTLDGVEVMSGAWNSTAENVTISADGLTVGDHTFVVTFTDGSGNSNTDTVMVTVLPDTTTPLILAIGAGGAIIAVVIVIYLMKKKKPAE